MTRVALISIVPADDVSNAKLQAELKKCLKSKSFTVDRIAILDDQAEKIVVTPSTKQR